ncbi:M20 metallopeptidase family protein [Halanaerobaculum tunisiense]
MNKQINDLVAAIKPWMINHRRDIHQYPESSYQESRTAQKVSSILKDLGIEVETGYCDTGVVGIIRGEKPGGTIGLRFDMDALEIEEETGLSFASQQKGLMHACGHDGHTAIGLGVAKVLVQMKEQIKGNVKLIFQPAEEDALNGGGAQYMIEEGVLEEPKVDVMAGLHIWPELELGTVGTRVGPIMAASDPFTIDIQGKGAHASLPDQAVDPILIGSEIVSNIQTIVSKNIDPFEEAVVTIGKFCGGTSYNIIPESTRLAGTVRTFNEQVRKKVYNKLTSITEKTAKTFGGQAKLNYTFGYPATINDSPMVELLKETVTDILGANNYIQVARPASGGEDFAYFAQEVPAVYMWLGYQEDNKELHPPHSPQFDFNEQVLAIGAKCLVKLALKWGGKHSVR